MRRWLTGAGAAVLIGPLAFLLAIVTLSVVMAARGLAPDAIGPAVADMAPAILLGALLVMAAYALALLPWRALWRQGNGKWPVDLVLGGAIGLALAALYLTWLAPVLTLLQARFGDYVPPGAVLATISLDRTLFFLADVVLAPLVEETIYRGHILSRLTARFGPALGIVLTCAAFGLLHWTGGVWYMALTGIVAGLPLALLARMRGGLLAPWAAHFALNLVEFLSTL